MRSFHLKSSFTFLLWYLLSAHSAFSQNEFLQNFQTLDEENGLSDNNVQCIYKDQRGFMWVGTKSGLNLIDGSTISVFKNDPANKNSISDNIINCITSDSNGRLWIGTQQGLNSCDPTYRKFAVIPLIPSSNQINNVTSIAINNENRVFIATYSGLFIYDQENRKMSFAEMPGENYEKLLNSRITDMCFGKNGLLYLTTFNGLWSYNVKLTRFTHEINSENDSKFTGLFTNLIIDHSGILWIGTWDRGLKEFDPETRRISNYPLTDNKVFNIQSLTEVKQPDGSWIILLNNNLRCFDPKKGKLVNSFANPDKNLDVSVLFTSNKNWVWVGTNKGLFFYNPSRNFIRHNRFVSSISSQGVSLLEWRNKILVGGSNQNFLKLYDEDLHEEKNFSKMIGGSQISCLAMQMSGADMIKCGTSDGIADINLLTSKDHFHQLQDTGLSKPGFRFITTLLKDSKNVWWIFPWRNGIWVTDSSTRNTRQVFNNFLTEGNIPKPLVIGSACEDKNNNIWFGDYDEGVVFYKRSSKKFSKPFVKYLGPKNAISQIVYNNGFCYSFFYNNLLMWNVDSMQLYQTRLPEAIDKSVTSIALDSSGNLWMSTQNGLIAYNINKKTFHHFTTSDGLLSNAMNGTLYCCKNGTMIYACPEYISSFKPGEMLKVIGGIPHIELSEVIVNEEPYFFDVLKKQYLNHNAYNFIFKWTVTDFSNPLNNRYSYKLEGIDKDWRLAGKEGKVEFANLSPGDYTLLLKAENSNGVSADKILKLQFAIQLPFWKTWWFLILLFLLIGFSFYSLLRYRINQLKKIEKLRNKISLNLHDDIGSTLSSISILSDMALHDKKDNEARDMLKEIKENSLSMMERMDDIVWSINPRNDSLENLFLRIKTFAAKLFEAKEINYKINISDEIRHIHLEMENRQHIYLIMKEAINNIVKYSDCTEANINVDYNASHLTMVLKDNGKGFDMQKTSYGNGLNNMKKRAKEIKAEINIVSKINEGTKITLVAKIK